MTQVMNISASSQWQYLRSLILKEIEACRDKLETQGTDQAVTEHYRGMIAAYRQVQKLAEPEVIDMTPASVDYMFNNDPQ